MIFKNYPANLQDIAWGAFRQDLEDLFEQNLTPIQVRVQLQGKWSVEKEEIAREISDFLEEVRRFDTCQRRGHHDIAMEAHITPDSGSEDWYCRYCHIGGTHTYY